MSVATRVAQFLQALKDYAPIDPDPTLTQRVAAWCDYYKCLHIILKRQHELTTTYGGALGRYMHKLDTMSADNPHPRVTVQAELRDLQALRTELLHETGSFYLFATFLLDDLAYVFLRYFALPWSRIEATHAQLTLHWQALCAEKALVRPSADLLPLMRQLHQCIAESAITLHELASHDLPHIAALIEEYIVAMVEVLAVHRAQSIYSGNNLTPATISLIGRTSANDAYMPPWSREQTNR